MQLQVMSMASTVAFSKDAFPTRRRYSPANPSSCLPKQAQFSCVNVQAQLSRLSSALRSLAAQAAYGLRAQPDLRFGTYYRRGSRFEN
jgi:hypothetical protein